MIPTTEKTCPRCNETKPAIAFNKNTRRKDGLQTYCRDCQRERERENYAKSPKRRRQITERRIENNLRYREQAEQFIVDYLRSHPCVDCGETNIIVLQFDHVRGKKRENISVLVTRVTSLQTIIAEVKKCEIRCANCHARKTAREGGYWLYRFALEDETYE